MRKTVTITAADLRKARYLWRDYEEIVVNCEDNWNAQERRKSWLLALQRLLRQLDGKED